MSSSGPEVAAASWLGGLGGCPFGGPFGAQRCSGGRKLAGAVGGWLESGPGGSLGRLGVGCGQWARGASSMQLGGGGGGGGGGGSWEKMSGKKINNTAWQTI